MRELELLELPIEEFIKECKELIPAVYGNLFTKKIILDSNNKMREIAGYEDRGDVTIGGKKHFEVKTSYLNKTGKFSIKNIRPWQSFDYFILCLIDTSESKYKSYFYCVPKDVIVNSPVLVFAGQNNTKVINEMNKNIGIATTVDLNDHSWLFKNENILSGTNYLDLMNFIDTNYNQIYGRSSTYKPKIPFVPSLPKRSAIQKIYLKMGDQIIDGNTNKEVMTKMVEYIGPKKLHGIVWSTWLNQTQSRDRNVYVGDNYYFNPKFSIRDLTTTIQQINKKLNLSIQILKK